MNESFLSAFIPNLSFQLVARLFSFVLNIYLIRIVDLSLLGVVNVSLFLYYGTIIFLVREPFRRTFLSNTVPFSSILGHCWLCPLLYVVVAVLLYPLWIYTSWPSVVGSPTKALFLFGFSAWLESFADPFVIIASLFYLVVAYYFARHCLYEGRYVLAGGIFPQFHLSVSKRELKTFSSFVWHSFAKHFSTEGANFVLTFAANMSHENQAVYDAIDKLGSLVVRIVLTPLDQAAEMYFARYLKRGENVNKQNEINVRRGTTCLMGLVHLALLVGLTVCTFAVPYSSLGVWIYGGERFAEKSAANILRFYCVYVLIIAVNGVIECFATSTMDNIQTVKHGTFLSIASFAQFVVSAFACRHLGAYGIILGNSLNVLIRIFYNWRRIQEYLNGKVSFTEVLPSFTIFFLLLFALATSSLSFLIFGREKGIIHNSAHLAVGGALFMFVVNYVYHNDEALAVLLREYSHVQKD
ncbi:unnamed protein product [Enterobius vermicularis]|uniref:Protein RFT1 homolog n=1 Tax=Enterobius vermicularis TaxID=51028 RepID=A0A0N4VAG3_ENTVE|nr:unnamed protein product [Enterobius vermicularis]